MDFGVWGFVAAIISGVIALLAGMAQIADYLKKQRFKNKVVVVIKRHDKEPKMTWKAWTGWKHQVAKFYLSDFSGKQFIDKNGNSRSISNVIFGIEDESIYIEKETDTPVQKIIKRQQSDKSLAEVAIKEEAERGDDFRVIDNDSFEKWTFSVDGRKPLILYFKMIGDHDIGEVKKIETVGGAKYTYKFIQTDKDTCEFHKTDETALTDSDLV